MKNEFLSVVSHELRTPLTAIRGSLGLIAGGGLGELPAPASSGRHRARESSERLTRLINDMLDIERIESGTRRCSVTDRGAPLVALAVQQVRGVAGPAGVTSRSVACTGG